MGTAEACESDEAWIWYTYETCGTPVNGDPPVCVLGSSGCHRRCASDSDCVDPAHPLCLWLGLRTDDSGTFVSCSTGTKACVENEHRGCPVQKFAQ